MKDALKYGLPTSALAVFLVFYGLQFLVSKFLQREEVLRRNPVSAIVASSDKKTVSTSSVLLYGDSRVAEWWLPNNSTVSKIGVGGATSGELRWALAHLNQEFKGRKVLIQCGINDIKSAKYSLFTKQEIVDNCVENITGITEFFLDKEASCVIVLGLFPTSEVPIWRAPFWSQESIVELRLLINQRLSDLENGIQYINCDHLLASKNLYRDELHFRSSAYQLLNNYLELEV